MKTEELDDIANHMEHGNHIDMSLDAQAGMLRLAARRIEHLELQLKHITLLVAAGVSVALLGADEPGKAQEALRTAIEGAKEEDQ